MGLPVMGSANPNGTVNTQGRTFNNTSLSPVNPVTCTSASGADSTATGLCANAGAAGATAYGSQTWATGSNTTAIGFRATASNAGATAMGYQSQATGTNATAIGSGAVASGSNSVALGANSVATQDNSVSVGSSGAERTITNVAAGVNSTDAVNVSQLRGIAQNFSNQINGVARIAYSGVAMSMALAGTNYIPNLEPGEKALGVGVGSFQGYGAAAVNFRSMNESGGMVWGVGVSSTGSQWGVNAGIGWKWR